MINLSNFEYIVWVCNVIEREIIGVEWLLIVMKNLNFFIIWFKCFFLIFFFR